MPNSIMTEAKKNNAPNSYNPEQSGMRQSTAYENDLQMDLSVEEIALQEFKELDKDGNLKVSKQEFMDAVIDDYVIHRDTEGQRPSDIAAHIQERAEAFTKHAGDDEAMNIDEYNIFKQANPQPVIDKPVSEQEVPNIQPAEPNSID